MNEKLNYEKRKNEIFESKHAIGISINIYSTLFYLFSCVLLRLLRDTQIRRDRESKDKANKFTLPY